MSSNSTITERLDNHETRITALEQQTTEAKKPWFLMKGVLGPMTSGVATVALVIGYIMNWPADAMAVLAAVVNTGVIFPRIAGVKFPTLSRP